MYQRVGTKRDERRDAYMPVEEVQTEAVETVEAETTETEIVEAKADEAPEQVDTKETEVTTELEETKEETTETVEDAEPEDESSDDSSDADESDKESTKEVESLKGKVKTEQKKVEDLKNQVKGLEAVVSSIVDSKLTEIPKEFHALIPEGGLVAKLEWINKAEASGLFKKAEPKDVEIGKPLNLGKKSEKANSNTTAQQKLSNYFSNFYSK